MRISQQISEATGYEPRRRVLAQRLGGAAARSLDESSESGLVAMVNGSTRLVPFAEVMAGHAHRRSDDELVITARRRPGIAFGAEGLGTFFEKAGEAPPVSGVALRGDGIAPIAASGPRPERHPADRSASRA